MPSAFSRYHFVMLIAALWASALTIARADDDDDEGGGSGDSEQIELEGSIPAKCEFTETPQDEDIGALQTTSEVTLGTLAFECNLATVSTVHITATSANGGLKHQMVDVTIPYSISWQIQSNLSFTLASALVPFDLQSGINGNDESGLYKVKVIGPITGLPAGTYKDTVTYTISP